MFSLQLSQQYYTQYMLEGIGVPFFAILFAELFDKSQLAILLLATKTKNKTLLLAGVMLAFLIVDGSAILFGSVLTTRIPQAVLKLISGILFLLFGILALKNATSKEKPRAKAHANAFLSGFLVVFFSEWGDKTQLASAVFASRYHPFFVTVGVLLALFVISFLAITVGTIMLKKCNPQKIRMLAGILFILLGLGFFVW